LLLEPIRFDCMQSGESGGALMVGGLIIDGKLMMFVL
jgi:hypothetical protein